MCSVLSIWGGNSFVLVALVQCSGVAEVCGALSEVGGRGPLAPMYVMT